jgi:transketolase
MMVQEARVEAENEMDRLTDAQKEILAKIATTIRGLTIDATQKADSGHPGLPMGCAEFGAYLYGIALRCNPNQPKWLNRDHFILSAGHGSMLLYSCLHLAGYDLPIEELRQFRQLHSKTPGHPESHLTPGVETTTGPLGQGLANAVGTAIGLKAVAARFTQEEYPLFDGKVFALAGDGCIMEGVTSEASSFAGHLGLDNLVVFYDANKVSLDGPLHESCSENTKLRYEAYGWDVVEINGHDFDEIHFAFSRARKQKRPLLVIMHTIIGKGSLHKAGTYKVHGSPLGEEEARLTKAALHLPEEPFFVPNAVKEYFLNKTAAREQEFHDWNRLLERWKKQFPERAQELDVLLQKRLPADLESELTKLAITEPTSGRKASQDVLNYLADHLPSLLGGSADLSCSDLTYLKKYPQIQKGDFSGRNLKFGVREFAMACMASGIHQTGFFIPFIGTFLTFSDYMRNAIRLASIMHEQVIYQFTHDSVFLGEDGPTHQPIEHLATLRAIPHLHVIRPAGAHEVKMAWLAALEYKGPTALIFSRQNVPAVPGTHVKYKEGLAKGGYIVQGDTTLVDYCLIATGSELPLACSVAFELQNRGYKVRVISMPCTELFDKQLKEYKDQLLGNAKQLVSIEAAIDMTWYKYIGRGGIAIAMEDYGVSAPYKDITKYFGFTVDAILERILTKAK